VCLFPRAQNPRLSVGATPFSLGIRYVSEKRMCLEDPNSALYAHRQLNGDGMAPLDSVLTGGSVGFPCEFHHPPLSLPRKRVRCQSCSPFTQKRGSHTLLRIAAISPVISSIKIYLNDSCSSAFLASLYCRFQTPTPHQLLLQNLVPLFWKISFGQYLVQYSQSDCCDCGMETNVKKK
jgi:hypothetical protein